MALPFLSRLFRGRKTSAAIVAAPEPPRLSACPDLGAAAPTLSPFAEAVLAGAVIATQAVAAGLTLSLLPGQLFVAAASGWSAR
ncbi:hypothetical protein GGQ86_000834 [Xanthobacter flavus]|uniref:Uncharacterized protein n=1 Tax=Xanthobacter flavus TaxID=281 RepID=A0A9W6CMG3_XANFL|nr:hypothetical protein [Xanthobacter flavus]MDR6332387.1 hypothetical protein [Xanthobacter flavus]GLI21862.1 hypothetical protein XFLAVUS301_15360 [Xanthobacter flavus]